MTARDATFTVEAVRDAIIALGAAPVVDDLFAPTAYAELNAQLLGLLTDSGVYNAQMAELTVNTFALSTLPTYSQLLTLPFLSNGGDLFIQADLSANVFSGSLTALSGAVFLDGLFVRAAVSNVTGAVQSLTVSTRNQAPLAAGAHTIDLRWGTVQPGRLMVCNPVTGSPYYHATLKAVEVGV